MIWPSNVATHINVRLHPNSEPHHNSHHEPKHPKEQDSTGKMHDYLCGGTKICIVRNGSRLGADSIFAESFLHYEDNGHTYHKVSLNADGYLFGLIHAHLKGYEIFPFPAQGIPYGGGCFSGQDSARMTIYLSKEATLKNLLRDATDFGLTNLVAKIEQEMANQVNASKEAKARPTDEDSEAAKGFEILNSNDDFELAG